MTTDDAALAVATALEAEGVPYIIVGGYSSNTHGIPRATKDVDVVVSISAYQFPDLIKHLGPQWHRDPQLSFETNTGTMREILELKGTPLKVEIFALSDDEHDQSRFARRIRKPFTNQEVSFPTAEDVIIWKLRWARPKDLDDVRNVILVQQREATLDWPYIRDWCAKHGTTARLEEILASLPKRR
jgi:Nucleotidyl transferase of unknown function (DUF2204)